MVIDGARQNFQRSGHNGNGQFFLEPELVAEVDVVRGPVANVYGSGAIGGVVSFRTKDVQDVLRPGERIGALMNMNLGSNERRGLGSLFAAARPNENIDLFAGGTYRSQSNYRDGHGDIVPNSGYDMATAIAKTTFRPADGHEIKLGGTTLDSQYKTGQNVPNQELVYNTHVVNNILTGRYRYALPNDRIFNFDGNVYWTTTKQDQTKILNGTPGSLGNPITGFIGDTRQFMIDTKGFDAANTSRFDVGEFRNFFTVGGDLFRDEVSNTDRTGNGEVTTPDGVRTVSGAFAQWKGQFRWLEVIGALRYDNYELKSALNQASGDHLSPKATVGITPVNGFTVYGTFAEGYRAPAVTETLILGPHPPFALGLPQPVHLRAEPEPAPRDRPDQGNRRQSQIRRHRLQGRQAAHQGECVPQRHRGLYRAREFRSAGHVLPGAASRLSAGAAHPDQQLLVLAVPEHRHRRRSRASSSRAPMTRATGSSACRASTSAAATRPAICRCSTFRPTRSPPRSACACSSASSPWWCAGRRSRRRPRAKFRIATRAASRTSHRPRVTIW